MTRILRIAIAQLNPTVGDISGNMEKIRAAYKRAAADGADVLLTPELSLIGYPAEDLVLKPFFQRSARHCAQDLAKETADGGPALIVGAPWTEDGKLYNTALVMDEGKILHAIKKQALPNYGVFDEKRVFAAAGPQDPVRVRGVKLGIMICEDMWSDEAADHLKAHGAEILLVPTASPFETDKIDERLKEAHARVHETGLGLVFANQVGGQDEVIFDGTSFVLNAKAQIKAQLSGFAEDYAVVSFEKSGDRFDPVPANQVPVYDDLDAIYHAAMLGLTDYVEKNGFPGVLIGLSGGIDSALTAAIAVDALGAERVRTVMMPSKYTSQESLDDAAGCAKLLGAKLDTIPIAPGVDAMDHMLAPLFEGKSPDVTEENIQSRLRAVILMAMSNKFGDLLLTTGNKSEVSVGYATLYGDMCGGYSVLKDMYKTTVFALSRWRNEKKPRDAKGPAGPVMPDRIITKPPTAELRADQKDEDSLPPYDVLDDILRCLVELNMASSDIVARGHDAQTVARIEHLLYVAEYKRRQAAPGVKITRKSFGRDRRYPITNGFRTARRPCP